MADIYEPKPSPRENLRQVSGKKPLGATLVTILAGFGAVLLGWAWASMAEFILYPNYAMFIILIGAANVVLGLLDIIVGLCIWDWKYSMRIPGVIINIVLIVLNLFFLVIGFLGLILCVGSIIALILLDPDS